MPTYEYHCSHCNEIKEIVQKMSDPECKICPDCHRETLTKRIPSSVNFRFVGSGFYATDYQNKSSCCGKCEGKCSHKHKAE